MTQIIEYLTQIQTLIGVIVGVVIAGIVAYKQIKAELTKAELLKATGELIAKAETSPINLAKSLVNQDVVPFTAAALSNEGKNSIVTQALIEREPKLLKKMKLADAIQIGSWVNTAYQTLKPLIKGLKK